MFPWPASLSFSLDSVSVFIFCHGCFLSKEMPLLEFSNVLSIFSFYIEHHLRINSNI